MQAGSARPCSRSTGTMARLITGTTATRHPVTPARGTADTIRRASTVIAPTPQASIPTGATPTGTGPTPPTRHGTTEDRTGGDTTATVPTDAGTTTVDIPDTGTTDTGARTAIIDEQAGQEDRPGSSRPSSFSGGCRLRSMTDVPEQVC